MLIQLLLARQAQLGKLVAVEAQGLLGRQELLGRHQQLQAQRAQQELVLLAQQAQRVFLAVSMRR